MKRRRVSGRHRTFAEGRLETLDATAALYHPAPDDDPDLHAREVDEASEEVRSAVENALTSRQREIVELYFFEGLSQGAIAARLGVTQQVVHKSLFGTVRDGRIVGGAIARLRSALEPWWQGRARDAGCVENTR